jgi:HSP20 family protein
MSDTQVQTDALSKSTSPTWKPEEIPQLTVDVHRKGETIFVVSTVAGVKSEDLDIAINDNTLSIKGTRKKPYISSETMVLLEECFWGEFYRELTINENLDVEKIKAKLDQGILIIEIPILKISSHKKIVVSAV